MNIGEYHKRKTTRLTFIFFTFNSYGFKRINCVSQWFIEGKKVMIWEKRNNCSSTLVFMIVVVCRKSSKNFEKDFVVIFYAIEVVIDLLFHCLIRCLYQNIGNMISTVNNSMRYSFWLCFFRKLIIRVNNQRWFFALFMYVLDNE